MNFENFSLRFNWSNWDKSQVRYYEHNEVIYLIIFALSEIPSCPTACPLSANPRPSALDTACNKMIRLSIIFNSITQVRFQERNILVETLNIFKHFFGEN